eukprot:INCI15430.3.p2 GENE.INCI15430.3~~INCI15430.3.p2  ORF type:complete len:248 (+),score=44.32 INCI15430.3:101-745(+)
MSKAAKDNNSPHYMAKVAVVGAPKVGKSTLVQRFVSPDVEPKAKSVFNTKTVSIDGSSIQLQIWTAFAPNIYRWFQQQTDRFPVYYRGADAIIVVYDVTSIPSFDNAKIWAQNAKKITPPGTKLLLVGNKADSHKRQVSTGRGQAEAEKLNIPFLEISAKANHQSAQLPFVMQAARVLLDKKDKVAKEQAPQAPRLIRLQKPRSPKQRKKVCFW